MDRRDQIGFHPREYFLITQKLLKISILGQKTIKNFLQNIEMADLRDSGRFLTEVLELFDKIFHYTTEKSQSYQFICKEL